MYIIYCSYKARIRRTIARTTTSSTFLLAVSGAVVHTMSSQFPVAMAPSLLLHWPVDSLHHTTPFVPGAHRHSNNCADMMVMLEAKEFSLHYPSSKGNPHEIQAC
eukprot:scaffold101114_cov61-Attheya_sp.AAC.1